MTRKQTKVSRRRQFGINTKNQKQGDFVYIFSLDKMVIFVDNKGYEKMVCCMYESEK